MSKKLLSSLLIIVLILALCVSISACGKGAAVGDTFEYGGGTIKLSKIEEGAASGFHGAGQPDVGYKYVTMSFTPEKTDGDFMIDYKGFFVKGKEAKDAIGTFEDGGLVLKVLFEVPLGADIKNLDLKVEG